MKPFFRQFTNGEVFPWERSFTNEALNVAIPIVIQSLFMAMMHIVDSLMIGQLGEVELAAVAQANRVTFLYQLVIFGLVSGTSAFVAQYWGKRDLKGIHSVLGLSLCLSLLAALCFLIPCQLFPSSIMRLLLQDEAAVEAAVSYLSVVSFGYLFTAVSQCYATVQKSTEQARLPMFAEVLGLLTNVFFNYCLIFGNLGFPRLGVRGGAIATVAGLLVLLLTIVIMGYRLNLATAARFSALVPRSLAFAKKYLSVALPVIANEVLWSLAMVMYSVVYGHMGTGVVAAISIFNAVEQVSHATSRGLTHACAVLVGKRIGAGNEDDAQKTAKRMLFAALPMAALSCVILLLISNPIVSLFNVSPQVAEDARTLIRISAFLYLIPQLGGLLVVGIMRSGGDVRMSLLLDAGTAWIIGAPLVAISGLVLGLPIPYVFMISYAESVVKIIFGLWRYRSRKWIHNLVRDV